MTRRITAFVLVMFLIGSLGGGDVEGGEQTLDLLAGTVSTCQEQVYGCGADPIESLFATEVVGEGCCQRHLDMAETVCFCGIAFFQCSDNGRGGCDSSWSCSICPV